MSNNVKNPTTNQAISETICKFCAKLCGYIESDYKMNTMMSLKDVTDTSIRMSNRADAKFIAGDRGQELINKATYYKIPYKEFKTNWLDLIDEIADYEMLLEEAHDLGIEWNMSEYDPVALQQEIEYYERKEKEAHQDLYRSFYNQATLGV